MLQKIEQTNFVVDTRGVKFLVNRKGEILNLSPLTSQKQNLYTQANDTKRMIDEACPNSH